MKELNQNEINEEIERDQLLNRFYDALSFVDNKQLLQLTELAEHIINRKRVIEGYYIPDYDITIVFSSINNGSELAVTGFYHGMPDSRIDKEYDCDWVADLDLD